ncbi:MAG TPA: hypothetical protein VG826_20975 [Pirellulales bacterium]|nr:hypothetical protein [Pirellulales bacterium]
MSKRLRWAPTAVIVAVLCQGVSNADDDPFAEDPQQVPPQARQALIVCGLPGDEEHRTLFAETIEKLYAGLTTRLEIAPEHVVVLFSGEPTDKDGPALRANRGPATREKLAETAAELEKSLQRDDALWVFVLGHAHFDGRFSWLNLPGPDLNQVEFAKLFATLPCREQVFFITTPASGFFVKPLAAAGRAVITATEADAEVNETVFPHKLAIALAEPPPMSQFDVDGDGRSTLLDVYLWCAREIAQEYAANELLATEHSLVDDDGDGRGSELQLDYLSEELGGRVRAGKKRPALRTADGVRLRSILLPMPPAAAPEPAAPAEPAS